MTPPRFRIGLLSFALVVFTHPLTAQEDPAAKQEAPATKQEVAAPAYRPDPFLPVADQGRFTIYKNEEPMLVSEFEWRADGSFEGKSTLSTGGQSVEFDLTIETDAERYWSKVVISAPSGTAESTIRGDKVHNRAPESDSGQDIDFEDGAYFWFDFHPVFLRELLADYDQEAAGTQNFPIFVAPLTVMETTLRRKDRLERAVAGHDLALTRYELGMQTVEMTVWADQDHRILMVEVPSQYATYIREGFEGLRLEEDDSRLSQPEHEWSLRDEVMVPMRDGVRLATDIYLPATEGRFPLILIRTPYKKEISELQGKFYARRGYAVAIQDVRGRFESEGDWVPWFREARDGHDAIEWLAEQDFCDGKIGMIGASYLGWAQWVAARERPPHLVTIIPNVSPPDPYFNFPYEYGTFFMAGAIWWTQVLEQEATADITGGEMLGLIGNIMNDELYHLPVIDLDEVLVGRKIDYWRSWLTHPSYDDWWDDSSFMNRLDEVRIPVFHQSGWFDGDGIGAKLNYRQMASHGHPHQKLVLGPWGHTDTATRSDGENDYGAKAIVDLQREYLRWFDRWLKGLENGIEQEPLVSLFVMNTNDWLHGNTYPLEGTEFQKWYFHSGGQANTSAGDGRLSTKTPGADEPADQYVYDPAQPTRSHHVPPRGHDDEEEEFDERCVNGKDVLVYQTEPLEQELTLAGPLSAVIYAATDAKDTDWFVSVVMIKEDGEEFPLAEGKFRARYRDSFAEPKLLEPGEIVAYTLDCWQTGVTLEVGMRLRVEVASASFPAFSRNLNTGGHNELDTEFVSATQTIFHDAEHPSHVLLPVIPNPEW